MKPNSIQLLRTNSISGIFYKGNDPTTKTLVVYGLGAPISPDTGLLPEVKAMLKFNLDLFVPDYIGFGRSEGVFTPLNTIKTFLKLFKAFKQGCVLKNHYQNLNYFVKYTNIHFIGRSFGGMYILLLPRFNPQITNLCAIFPILDYQECGKIPGEETIKGFFKAINKDGYQHLYRGIKKPIWLKHFNNQDGLRPVENLKFLNKAKVFIAHGKKDKNINYSHSVNFFNQLTSQFSKHDLQYKLMIDQKGLHNSQTAFRAIHQYLKWQKLKPLS